MVYALVPPVVGSRPIVCTVGFVRVLNIHYLFRHYLGAVLAKVASENRQRETYATPSDHDNHMLLHNIPAWGLPTASSAVCAAVLPVVASRTIYKRVRVLILMTSPGVWQGAD